MVFDVLKNYVLYLKTNERMEKGFEFIKKFHEVELPDGRYELDGQDVYALVQSYETKPEKEKSWEAHREYIDLQYVVKGGESIYWTNINGLNVSKQYDAEKDYMLFEGEGGTQLKVESGHFVILLPGDAHKPGCVLESVQAIKKIVVKVRV